MVRRFCRWWLSAGLILGALMLIASACGGGDGDGQVEPTAVSGNVIEIPQSALEALDEYAFTSDIDMSSNGGHLAATFDASFRAPDRFQGTLTATGEPSEHLLGDLEVFLLQVPFELPLETELIAIGGQIWTRQIDGEWQDVSVFDGIGPFGRLIFLGTPPVYLSFFKFDALRLPAAGPAEMVNGVRARPVRLDKAGLIALLTQGTVCAGRPTEEPPCTPPWQDTQQQAQLTLPDDFAVETWIAEEGNYPTASSLPSTSTRELKETLSASGRRSTCAFRSTSRIRTSTWRSSRQYRAKSELPYSVNRRYSVGRRPGSASMSPSTS